MDSPVPFSSTPTLPNTVIWSEDNQIAVVTHLSVNVITPTESKDAERQHVKYRTCTTQLNDNDRLELQRPNDETCARSADSCPEGFRSAAWSPAGCAQGGGCLLLTVSVSHRVCIWKPKLHPMTSEWVKVKDMTDSLIEYNRARSITLPVFRKLETVSANWSPVYHTNTADPLSIIALGSKEGTVTLWRYSTSGISFFASFRSGNSWVRQLSWSPNIVLRDNHLCAFLAIGSSDGSVCIWKVSQDSLHEIGHVELYATLLIKDKRIPEVLSWFHSKIQNDLKLAVAKIDMVLVCEIAPGQPATDVPVCCAEFQLPLSMPISTLTWNLTGDELRIFTFDGKYRVAGYYNNVLSVDETRSRLMEQRIHQLCQQQAALEEQGEDDDAEKTEVDVGKRKSADSKVAQPQFYGSATSAHGLQIAFAYSLQSASEVEYKTENIKSSCLSFISTVQSGDAELEEQLLYCLRASLDDPGLVSPSFLLWDIFVYAIGTPYINDNDNHFLNRIMALFVEYYLASDETAVALSDTPADTVTRFYNSLYSDGGSHALRLLVYLHTQLLPHTTGILKSHLNEKISRNTQIIFGMYLQKLLSLVVGELEMLEASPYSDMSKKSIGLLCDWAIRSFQDRPSLVKAATKILQGLSLPSDVESSASNSRPSSTSEECPACLAEVPLNSTSVGYCANGHIWDRCSATLLIASTLNVTSCIGCNRKLLSLSDTVNVEDAPLFERLISAVNKCLFCGARFTKKYT